VTRMKTRDVSAIEAARQLRVGLDYLYGLLWTGKLEARKVGNRWRVSAAAIEARLKQKGE